VNLTKPKQWNAGAGMHGSGEGVKRPIFIQGRSEIPKKEKKKKGYEKQRHPKKTPEKSGTWPSKRDEQSSKKFEDGKKVVGKKGGTLISELGLPTDYPEGRGR